MIRKLVEYSGRCFLKMKFEDSFRIHGFIVVNFKDEDDMIKSVTDYLLEKYKHLPEVKLQGMMIKPVDEIGVTHDR